MDDTYNKISLDTALYHRVKLLYIFTSKIPFYLFGWCNLKSKTDFEIVQFKN